jgi:hypothetical protein
MRAAFNQSRAYIRDNARTASKVTRTVKNAGSNKCEQREDFTRHRPRNENNKARGRRASSEKQQTCIFITLFFNTKGHKRSKLKQIK